MKTAKKRIVNFNLPYFGNHIQRWIGCVEFELQPSRTFLLISTIIGLTPEIFTLLSPTTID